MNISDGNGWINQTDETLCNDSEVQVVSQVSIRIYVSWKINNKKCKCKLFKLLKITYSEQKLDLLRKGPMVSLKEKTEETNLLEKEVFLW